jgi:hypothetical protein
MDKTAEFSKVVEVTPENNDYKVMFCKKVIAPTRKYASVCFMDPNYLLEITGNMVLELTVKLKELIQRVQTTKSSGYFDDMHGLCGVTSVDPAGRWPANRVRSSVVRTSDAYGVQYSFEITMAEQMFEIETEYVKDGTVAEEDALFNYVIEKMNLILNELCSFLDLFEDAEKHSLILE